MFTDFRIFDFDHFYRYEDAFGSHLQQDLVNSAIKYSQKRKVYADIVDADNKTEDSIIGTAGNSLFYSRAIHYYKIY